MERECGCRDDMVNSLFFVHRLQRWVSFHDNLNCQLNDQRYVLVVVGVIPILFQEFQWSLIKMNNFKGQH